MNPFLWTYTKQMEKYIIFLVIKFLIIVNGAAACAWYTTRRCGRQACVLSRCLKEDVENTTTFKSLCSWSTGKRVQWSSARQEDVRWWGLVAGRARAAADSWCLVVNNVVLLIDLHTVCLSLVCLARPALNVLYSLRLSASWRPVWSVSSFRSSCSCRFRFSSSAAFDSFSLFLIIIVLLLLLLVCIPLRAAVAVATTTPSSVWVSEKFN